MPLLATLLAGLFQSLASFAGRSLAAKVAFAAGIIAAFAALTVAFVAAISAALTAILWSGVLPNAFVLGFSFFMPDNFPTVVSTCITAEIAAALYRWNQRQVQLFAQTH